MQSAIGRSICHPQGSPIVTHQRATKGMALWVENNVPVDVVHNSEELPLWPFCPALICQGHLLVLRPLIGVRCRDAKAVWGPLWRPATCCLEAAPNDHAHQSTFRPASVLAADASLILVADTLTASLRPSSRCQAAPQSPPPASHSMYKPFAATPQPQVLSMSEKSVKCLYCRSLFSFRSTIYHDTPPPRTSRQIIRDQSLSTASAIMAHTSAPLSSSSRVGMKERPVLKLAKKLPNRLLTNSQLFMSVVRASSSGM